MYEIIDAERRHADPRYEPVFAALRALDSAGTYAIVKAPGDLEAVQHDLEGALRSMRYLAQKMSETYEAQGETERSRKLVASIRRHLETLETLKSQVLDKLFPTGGSGAPTASREGGL